MKDRKVAQAEVAAHYDELDEFYRRIWGEHLHHGLWTAGVGSRQQALEGLIKWVVRAAGIESGGRVADLGSGYGALARSLVHQFGVSVDAVTLSPRQHRFACQTEPGHTNPHYHLGDLLTCELGRERFSAVLAVESLEHLSDKAVFFPRAASLLEPGGRLVVTGWFAREGVSSLENWALLRPICRVARMPGLALERHYRASAEAAGLQLLQSEDLSRWAAPTWPQMAQTLLAGLRWSDWRWILPHWEFGPSLLRLGLAFACGSLRYGALSWVKPATKG